MRRIATGLVVLVVLTAGAALAGATGWGGSGGWSGSSGSIQYKKKKLCGLIQWLYDKHGNWSPRERVRTEFGWYSIAKLIEFCLGDLQIKPVCSFSSSPNPVRRSALVTFDGSGSRDPDGQVARWEWDLDGNGSFETVRTGPTVTRSYATTGVRTITLRVVDNSGLTSPVASSTLTVKR